MSSGVKYQLTGDAWRNFDAYIHELAGDSSCRRVCDIGGGANPIGAPASRLTPLESYTLLDISETELAKAPEGYDKVVADIASASPPDLGTYDLVFSKMLAEHVRSGEQLHRNIFKMLNPGGLAVHIFPTLYALPFLINHLMPEQLASAVLKKLSPQRLSTGRNDKFPAHYSWTLGPTSKQLARLEGIGYEVVEYLGMFGHEGYYERIPPIKKLHMAECRWLLAHPIPQLTSYARITLRKPG